MFLAMFLAIYGSFIQLRHVLYVIWNISIYCMGLRLALPFKLLPATTLSCGTTETVSENNLSYNSNQLLCHRKHSNVLYPVTVW